MHIIWVISGLESDFFSLENWSYFPSSLYIQFYWVVFWILFMLCYVGWGLCNVVFVFAVGVTLHFPLTFCGCWFWSQISFQSLGSATWGLPHAGASQGLVRLGCSVQSFPFSKLFDMVLWVCPMNAQLRVGLGIVQFLYRIRGFPSPSSFSSWFPPYSGLQGPFFRFVQKDRVSFGDWAATPLLCYCRWNSLLGSCPSSKLPE